MTGRSWRPTRPLIEIASVMRRQHSPVVAVVDEDDEILGVITVHRLLGASLPRS